MKNNQERENLPRRKALKLAAGGGAVVGSTLLAGQWSTPLVKAVILPAHAQTSMTMQVFSASANVGIGKSAPLQEKNILDLFIEPAIAGMESFEEVTLEAYAAQTGEAAFDFQFLITSSRLCKSETTPESEIFAFVEVSAADGSVTVPFQGICGGITAVNGSFDYELDGSSLELTNVEFNSEAFNVQLETLTMGPGGMPLQDPGACTLCPSNVE